MTRLIALAVYAAYSTLLSFALRGAGLGRTQSTDRRGSVGGHRKILVIGATGGTGQQLLEQALARDLDVTAFVRRPEKIQLSHAKLRVVQGDVLNRDSLDDAMQGQDAVLCALGHKKFLRPTRILSGGTQNILASMQSHDVKRLVCQTSLGIGYSAWRMGIYYSFFVIPVILQFYFWDKTRQEKAVAASDRDWIIVRPGALTNGASRGAWKTGSKIGNWFTTVRISRADVAAFMLDQLEDDEHLGTAVGVSW